LHAELEGMKMLPAMEKLLGLWRDAGDSVGPLRAVYDALDSSGLDHCSVVWGEVPGRAGRLALQGHIWENANAGSQPPEVTV
ncbi:MAG: hypothetical protein P8181_15145, partial [bacterium]